MLTRACKGYVPKVLPNGLIRAVVDLRTTLLCFHQIHTDSRSAIGYGGLPHDGFPPHLGRSGLATENYHNDWSRLWLAYEPYQLDVVLWSFWTAPETFLGVDYVGPDGWAGPGTAIWNELTVLVTVAGL